MSKQKAAPAVYVTKEDKQVSIFEQTKEWELEWNGMPEFEQRKQEAYATLIVRFRNEEDLQEFASRIGQKLKANSQSTWYPELISDDTLSYRYVDES